MTGNCQPKHLPFILLFMCALLSLSGRKHHSYQGFNLKEFEKSLVLIPGGSFLYGLGEYERRNAHLYMSHSDLFSKLPESRTISVDSFYIYIHEVSNGEYREFLTDLKENDTTLYKQMLPDSTILIGGTAYNDIWVGSNYYRHPAYSNHPIIGITYEQATRYCQWLTEKYMKEEKRKFKKVEFKLPAIGQWTYAAMALTGKQKFARFPWGSGRLQDEKGNWLANFNVVNQADLGRAQFQFTDSTGERKSGEVFMTAPGSAGYFHFGMASVISFHPNKYGIYNMGGNVEEYVREKGITKGGSWIDPAYYTQTWIEERYDTTHSSSQERGFRFVMELVIN